MHSRREREKLQQRQEILAVALALFSEKGYHNVSMQEIAGKADFAIGTLYKFFQNKEDLYKALVLEQSDKFYDVFVRTLEEPGDEVEIIRNFVRAKGKMFRDNLSFVRLYLAENRGASYTIKRNLNEEVRKRHYAFMEKLASVFENGIRNNRFRKISTAFHLAVALDSVVNAFLLLWLDAPELHPYPEDPDAILDIFFKGMVDP